jgi:hypothetical protein
MPLDENDYIDLVHGEFDQTNRYDLEQAFLAFESSKKNHLAVFFHGGLVSRSDGMAEADKLIAGYSGADAYPFFFIWNSGLLKALQRLLSPFADDAVIRRVVQRDMIFVIQEMLLVQGLLPEEQQRSLRGIAEQLGGDEPPLLTTLADLGRSVDAIWALRRGDVTLPLVEERIQAIRAFQEDLARDPIIVAFDRWMNQSKRFTPTLGSGILIRVWKRLRSGHDHGLYTTLIEEIAIAIGLDVILAGIWGSMKADIDNAFRADGAKYGGTAFLECLRAAWKDDMRLTLIAHSGGAVYINRLLNAIDDDKHLKKIKADIVFIAAALSFDAFAETIDDDVFKNRVRSYRFFALEDKCEGGYWEVPGVYDKSTLYMLSALCERDRDADKPLIGMERYWSGKNPYKTQNMITVTKTILKPERVWSPTPSSAPAGYQANAREHDDFAVEPETNASVQHFLR